MQNITDLVENCGNEHYFISILLPNSRLCNLKQIIQLDDSTLSCLNCERERFKDVRDHH